ncbi:class I SAM-dependent methyltransferase [Thermogutta sp.]|uniref:class I SAM-dependent methyltransferase n=1 Tax=Thermogutta sp. TaxID=1962930 RepID=UPI003C79948B
MSSKGILWVAVTAILVLIAAAAKGEEAPRPLIQSSRVPDPSILLQRDGSGYAYRAHVDFILQRLDIQPRDRILDLGAGDGWWTAHFAEKVGPEGIVYTAEVTQELVDQLKQRLHDHPNVKPCLCPRDRPGLPERSVDLVFLSQVYHHLDGKTRIDYWRELAKTVTPLGRVAVIETYPQIALRGKDHGTPLSTLAREAEEGGWVPVEVWFIPRTQHYLAIFMQQRVFFAERAPEQ